VLIGAGYLLVVDTAARSIAAIEVAGATGQGVILSTHDPDQAFALRADVVLMSAGRIIGRGPAEDVLSGEALSRVYKLC